MIVQGLFQGDRARYPFKFRTGVLITTSIVVAVLRKMKTQSTLYAYVGIPVVRDCLVRTKFCLFLQP